MHSHFINFETNKTIKPSKMSTPNGTPSKRSRNEGSGSQTPNRDPITPSRRTRSGSQQTPSQRTPNRNRKFCITDDCDAS